MLAVADIDGDLLPEIIGLRRPLYPPAFLRFHERQVQ
jgi:hypothetical protein